MMALMFLGLWREGSAWALLGTFLLAGGSKLTDDSAFPAAVAAYTGLPARAASYVARWLPVGEIVLGLAVGVPAVSRGAAATLALLTCGFLLGAHRAQRAGGAACGCFGALLPEPLGVAPWARNATLLGLCLSVLCLPQARDIPVSWLPGLGLPALLLLVGFHVDLLAPVR